MQKTTLKTKKFLWDKFVENNRKSTAYLKDYFKDKETVKGVEVGVYYGKNAAQLLKAIPSLRLSLVDPYDEYDGYDDDGLWTGTSLKEIKKDAYHLLRPYEERTRWLYRMSADVTELFGLGSLDFVYVDGNHAYAYVLEDCWAWWSKIKEGGVLLGHDWSQVGVARAVLEFADEVGAEVKVLNPALGFPEWVIKK